MRQEAEEGLSQLVPEEQHWGGLGWVGFLYQQQVKEGLRWWIVSGSVAGIQIAPWRLLWVAVAPLQSCGLVGHIYHLSIFWSFHLPKDPLILIEGFGWSWVSSYPKDVDFIQGLIQFTLNLQPSESKQTWALWKWMLSWGQQPLSLSSFFLGHHEALMWLASMCWSLTVLSTVHSFCT